MILNGQSPEVFSFNLKIASGLRNTSAGPMNPFIVRLIHLIAASVEIAAEAPLESES